MGVTIDDALAVVETLSWKEFSCYVVTCDGAFGPDVVPALQEPPRKKRESGKTCLLLNAHGKLYRVAVFDEFVPGKTTMKEATLDFAPPFTLDGRVVDFPTHQTTGRENVTYDVTYESGRRPTCVSAGTDGTWVCAFGTKRFRVRGFGTWEDATRLRKQIRDKQAPDNSQYVDTDLNVPLKTFATTISSNGASWFHVWYDVLFRHPIETGLALLENAADDDLLAYQESLAALWRRAELRRRAALSPSDETAL